MRLIQYMTAAQDNNIILDFFSGSATTAHAVMSLNAADGGCRRFILVQLPEPVRAGSAARQAGFTDICQIGRERIRRTAAKIAGDRPEAVFDGGFRVLRWEARCPPDQGGAEPENFI